VVIKKTGYEPKNITIDIGTTVTFVNNDAVALWPASNIHPTHGIYPEFDPKGEVAPGASWSFTFTKAGLWPYHDHLHPNVTGTISVE
jgi:plastocyanin